MIVIHMEQYRPHKMQKYSHDTRSAWNRDTNFGAVEDIVTAIPQVCVLLKLWSFDVLLTVHLSIFISVINQLDAQNFCFTISLFHASACVITPIGVMIPDAV